MRTCVAALSVSVGALLAGASQSNAQTNAFLGRVRGQVVDPQGKGIAGVRVEMSVQSGKPRKYLLTTDKKGGYVRVGVDEGKYTLTFTREGYTPASCTMSVSLGGISEIAPVTMQPLSAEAAAGEPSSATVRLDAEGFTKLKGSFDKANEALKAGDLDAAEAILKELAAAQPRVSEFHYNLGVVYERKKDLASAATEYRSATELDPGRSDVYVALAYVLLSSRQRDEAVKVIADALARFPEDGVLQFTFGVRYYELGLAQEAAAVFEKVRQLDPANPEPLYYVGLLALQKGLSEQALATLQNYVGLKGQDPRNLQVAQNLITALKKPH